MKLLRRRRNFKNRKILNIETLENTVVKARIILVDNSFIDVYYNYGNGKTPFALIKGTKRIFGTDNLDFWHILSKIQMSTRNQMKYLLKNF